MSRKTPVCPEIEDDESVVGCESRRGLGGDAKTPVGTTAMAMGQVMAERPSLAP